MAKIGALATLAVLRMTAVGAFLDGEQLGEILLPKRFIDRDCRVGDLLEVFIHKDSADRLIATTQIPKIQVDQFAYLKVTQVNEVGAFVDIGLAKELLVPFAEQARPMQVGRSYLIYCFLSTQDQRLVGTSKIDRWLNDVSGEDYSIHQEVSLIIGPATDLGRKVIVNQSCWGLIHHNRMRTSLQLGQCLPGYIDSVRPDGKINITLVQNATSQQTDADLVLAYLYRNDGISPIGDRSSPAQISHTFGLSKAAFKRAIGLLYRQKLIQLTAHGIQLVSK